MLISGMIIGGKLDFKFEIRACITIMLIMAFILRTSSRASEKLQTLMRKHLISALGITGLVHGLSNMGGSILTPLVSSLYQDKKKVLAGVSFDYAFMASLQLLVLIMINNVEFEVTYLVGPAISLFVRYTIGRKIFSFTSEARYQKLLNSFILANAFLLGVHLFN